MADTDDDDLFASLGGALMKNLLADLNDEGGSGGLLSLEELEQELSHLEDRPTQPSLPPVPEAPVSNSAAAMVLMAQQQDQRLNAAPAINEPSAPVDAWALSLEKFTAASLQDEFLQADSARKAAAKNPPIPLSTPLFDKAEEYDVSEPMVVSAPPGLQMANDTTQNLVDQLTSKLETVVSVGDSAPTPLPAPPVPKPQSIPKTPQNSMTFNLPKPAPPTPQNSVTVNLGGPPPGQVQNQQPPTPPNTLISQPREIIQQPPSGMPAPPPPDQQQIGPPNAWKQPPPPPPGAMMQQPRPPMQGGPPPMMMMPPPPMGMPGQPMPPPPVVFCDPTPRAQPVPASALASQYMSTRDISYVVHAILKPLLNHQQQNPPTPFDYDRAFFQRAGGVAPPTNTYNRTRQSGGKGKKTQNLEAEMQSREKKAKDWSAEHSVLGRTAKSNVTRPRALIAQPTKADTDGSKSKENSEQRQRQALWKARIYCDQAYQAYLKVVETWHAVMTPPNQNMSPSAAASLQPHLFKLLKCLGVAKSDQEPPTEDEGGDAQQQQIYAVVNETALPLLIKLPKGRVLLARVLEQALLPPAAVNALLPALFKAVYELPLPPPPSAATSPLDAEVAAAAVNAHMVDERLFAGIARVLHTLPDLPGPVILNCLDLASQNSSVSLQSTSRMSAVHALLQRGSQVAASDESFGSEWKVKEEAFVKILSG